MQLLLLAPLAMTASFPHPHPLGHHPVSVCRWPPLPGIQRHEPLQQGHLVDGAELYGDGLPLLRRWAVCGCVIVVGWAVTACCCKGEMAVVVNGAQAQSCTVCPASTGSLLMCCWHVLLTLPSLSCSPVPADFYRCVATSARLLVLAFSCRPAACLPPCVVLLTFACCCALPLCHHRPCLWPAHLLTVVLCCAWCRRPRYFLLENVRNFVSHNKSFTFCLTLRTLLDMGYQVGVFMCLCLCVCPCACARHMCTVSGVALHVLSPASPVYAVQLPASPPAPLCLHVTLPPVLPCVTGRSALECSTPATLAWPSRASAPSSGPLHLGSCCPSGRASCTASAPRSSPSTCPAACSTVPYRRR